MLILPFIFYKNKTNLLGALFVSFNLISEVSCLNVNIFSGSFPFQEIEAKYGFFPESLRHQMVQEAKKMFYFGYDSYMKYAFPLDELNPINCSGRGRDHENPGNININDILGDFSLTLIDSLDTLAILGNATEFQRAVKLVIQNVSFDKDSTVQVFEVNIRILGALLSAHLLLIDSSEPFGPLKPDWYNDELLRLAHDLASRLLPAFEKSHTGIPYPRVNLQSGLPEKPFSSETCPAGAGSLLLEMGILSKLLKDPVYEEHARNAIHALWRHRANSTGLLGNVIDARSGKWVGHLSGLGAGLDSYYEYLLKSYIMFGNTEDYAMFSMMYKRINQYMRRGRPECNSGEGNHPMFVNVHMQTGSVHTTWIDSLQASFAGIQVLHGDIEDAICTHILYYLLWKRYGVLPERWDWKHLAPSVSFYPLRPELIESTYLLYRATKNPFYLHVGKEILESLNKYTRTKCGYATVHSVVDMSLEDRMESFFLSETSKYLYLLFDQENYINRNFAKFVFNTEGHIFQSDFDTFGSFSDLGPPLSSFNITKAKCAKINEERRYFLPLKGEYLTQLSSALGVDT